VPQAPKLVTTLDVTPFGAVANSVAVLNGGVAVAVEADEKTDPGSVVFFGSNLASVRMGLAWIPPLPGKFGIPAEEVQF
jgi:hypothetical protein